MNYRKWTMEFSDWSSRKLPVYISMFLLLIFSFPISLPAQECNGDFELTSQTDIDNFNCTIVRGSLTIREAVAGNISNLDGLSELTTVEGQLNISNNLALTNVDGLASLVAANGLSIVDNDSLTNIDGLAALSGDLWNGVSIVNNISLTNVDGLASLNYVFDSLTIEGNAALNNVDGLSSLIWVGDDEIGRPLIIRDNDALTNVDGLASLNYVAGSLIFEGNDALTNVDGLAALREVAWAYKFLGGGDLIFFENNALTNVDGLAALTRVGGNLIFFENNALTNVDGLAALTHVGDYYGGNSYFEGNDSLSRCCGIYLLLNGGSGGEIIINENVTGCNSVDEILHAGPCMTTIQAEDYDEGGQHVAYYDKTSGNKGGQYRSDDVDIWKYGTSTYYTGANATNEWLNYTINVPSDGNYRLDIRLATPKDNRRVHVEFDGVDKTGPLTVPNTGGWTTWQTLSVNVDLNAGQQVMRLVIEYGGLNIDQISLMYIQGLAKVAKPTINPNGGTFDDAAEVRLSPATYGSSIYYTTDGSDPYTSATRIAYSDFFILTEDTTVRAFAWKAGFVDSDEARADIFVVPMAQPLTIQAEDYDEGGQNVAYYDTTPGNIGYVVSPPPPYTYRNDDVDIWDSQPLGKNFYIGANATGEWLNYTIDVPFDGNYRLTIRLATPKSNRRVHVEFDGVDKTGPLTVPNTGWWTTWQTLSTNVTLNAGQQVMRLVIEYGGLNIDYISLEYIGN